MTNDHQAYLYLLKDPTTNNYSISVTLPPVHGFRPLNSEVVFRLSFSTQRRAGQAVQALLQLLQLGDIYPAYTLPFLWHELSEAQVEEFKSFKEDSMEIEDEDIAPLVDEWVRLMATDDVDWLTSLAEDNDNPESDIDWVAVRREHLSARSLARAMSENL